MTLDSRLAALARVAPRAGIFCDFDGSLSPIVPDPEEARAVRGARAALARLALRFGLVAIVSGRSVGSLGRRLRVPRVLLVGLHGIEERQGRQFRVQPSAEAARPAVEGAVARLRAEVGGIEGVTVEHKGLAIAVHFRRARVPEVAQRAAEPAVRAAAAEAGLEVKPGRRILELVPPGGGDKGDAVRRLVAERGLEAALVLGDDTGDLPAFAAVAGLDPALRVAVASAESPRPLLDAADIVVGSPAEAVRLLHALADAAG